MHYLYIRTYICMYVCLYECMHGFSSNFSAKPTLTRSLRELQANALYQQPL